MNFLQKRFLYWTEPPEPSFRCGECRQESAPFTHFASTGSTMAEAKRIAESGKAQPGETHIITADVQTHGVGQSGKSWTTTRGSLAFTIITKNNLPL